MATTATQPKRMLRARELSNKLGYPFPLGLTEAIDEYVTATERDNLNWDAYMMNLYTSSRMLPDDKQDYVTWYYLRDGWRADEED